MPAAAVRQGGKIATTTATPAEETLAAADLTSSFIMAGPHREIVAPLADQAAAGDLKVNIATVLPLEKATDGLSTLASGQAKGKIVVTLDN